MRYLRGGVAHVASVIEEDLRDRETGLHAPHLTGLADLSASVLSCRSVNGSEWISVLPRMRCDAGSKERYIRRFLSNALIDHDAVMSGFIPEIVSLVCEEGKTAILMFDQSQITEDFQCLMVSLRVGTRAIPVSWRVVQSKGAIGWCVQEPLLDSVLKMIPAGVTILLSADRFYGTSAFVNWCQKQGWEYRIRLKGGLIFHHDGGEITGNDAVALQLQSLEKATFNGTNITTNIGILHEDGHAEPWLIAMNCRPNKYKTLDYGMRWGIECLFSDFKSRGFGITKTQLKHADRVERLILVLTIALYWAVSTGMKPDSKPPKSKKNAADPSHPSLKKDSESS